MGRMGGLWGLGLNSKGHSGARLFLMEVARSSCRALDEAVKDGMDLYYM
jgi:hypothetical protein